MDVGLANWNVKHLSLWVELVDTELVPDEKLSVVDMEAMEEATASAQYQEIRTKISLLDLYIWAGQAGLHARFGCLPRSEVG